MRAQLDSALAAFLALVDADLLKIPRAMRSMTLGELESCWAGSFADTSRAIAQRQFDATAPNTDEAAVIAAAKRKRDSPSRSTKNARSKPLPALPKTRRKAKAKQALPAATGERVSRVHIALTPATPGHRVQPPAPQDTEVPPAGEAERVVFQPERIPGDLWRRGRRPPRPSSDGGGGRACRRVFLCPKPSPHLPNPLVSL